MSERKRCCIVLITYKDKLQDNELKSFKQAINIFSGKYDLKILIPNNLSTSFYDALGGINGYVKVDASWMSSRNAYNNMMRTADFYKLFIDYQYILTYQTDCYVFYDNLEYFISLGYDWYGAPWPHEKNTVGNGGFSLRLVDKMIDVCSRHKVNNNLNEDLWFCRTYKNELKICNLEDACNFSIETLTDNYRKLLRGCPMGVHGKAMIQSWDKGKDFFVKDSKMKYITLNDLSETIRKNIWKIPRDIDFIIGIPRSGMIVASIISDYLNVPLIDINSFISGLEPYGGLRLNYFSKTHIKTNKVLVIDDTVSNGLSMGNAKKKLANFKDYQFVYACAYLEGRGESAVDIYLEDVRQYTNNFKDIVLYEWNIFQHHENITNGFLFDIDGVFCVEPPDERNEKEYIEYIKNATPLFIPRTKIGGIITYRLIKNKEITEKWLSDNGIKYNEIMMFNANSWDERNRSGITSEKYKADFYKSHSNYTLFIESSDFQAKRIAEMASKPVYCVETNKLYQ